MQYFPNAGVTLTDTPPILGIGCYSIVLHVITPTYRYLI